MRALIRVSSAAAVLLVASALPSIASAQAHQNTGFSQRHGFYWAMTPGESFTDAARQAARSSGGQVAATLKAMVRRAEAGGKVYVPQGTGHSIISLPATPSGLQTALSAVTPVSARAADSPRKPFSLDPVSFPVRGSGCNTIVRGGTTYYASWCDELFSIDAGFCGQQGCEITDRINARVTTNPGTSSTLTSYTSIYTYNAGDPLLNYIHFQWWVLCFRSQQQCGSNNTPDFYGNSSGKFYPNADIDPHGDHITHAYALWAHLIPNNTAYYSAGKTAAALCDPAGSGSNQCLYS
jgi:hypothetical protein